MLDSVFGGQMTMGATEKPFLAHFSWEASQKNVFYTWVYQGKDFLLFVNNYSKRNPGPNQKNSSQDS